MDVVDFFKLHTIMKAKLKIMIENGGSRGALAICVVDVLIALEYATLSVISPKICANILWKASSKASEAATLLKCKQMTYLN